jgi:hypothetical protein
MTLHRITIRSLVLGSLAAAAVLVATPHAGAQTGRRAMFTEAFRPDIMQRDIALLVSSLQLEEWQRPIMEALLEDYMTSFNTGVEAMKDKMKAAAEAVTQAGAANADQVLARTMEPLNAWRQEKERLGEKFMTDVKSQLGPQQLERARLICPEDSRVFRLLARISEREGDVEGACAALDEVVRLDPGYDIARRQRALLAESAAQPARFEDAWRWDAVERVGTLARSGNANDPVQVVDRTTLFDHGASDRGVSIDEFAVALHADCVARIDPALGWHLWGTDLCLQVLELAGQPATRILDVPLFHNSTNDYVLPQAFKDSAGLLLAKHPERARIPTLCGELSRPEPAHAPSGAFI